MHPRSRASRSLPLAFALAAATAACGDDGSDPPPDAPPTGPASVRVDAYAYELDLATQASSVALDLVLTSDGNCVTLPSRNVQLDPATATLGGQPATASLTDTQFTACGAGWAAGTPLQLAVRGIQPTGTWNDTQVGYSITSSGGATPHLYHYLVSWVEGCDRFGPCDTNPATFARYRFTVHHAEGTRVLCSGDLDATPTRTTCTFDHAGGPTYSTYGFIASTAFAETDLGLWGDTRVHLFERGNATRPVGAQIDAAYSAGFLTWMEGQFGAYPYGDALRLVVAPTYWSGFEHPGNIVLDSGLATQPSSYARPVTHVLHHEIAHQWAGDETTLASTYDFVWKEAMAEYLAFVYEDDTMPADALVTARAWKSFAAVSAYHPVPEDEPRPTLLQYYGHVYGPGPMILFRQLESLASRQQVFVALRTLLGQERAIGVADVQAALEASTGLDLDRYFDVWVRGAGAPVWPTFRTTVTGVPPEQSITVDEVTPGGVLHGCNFAVEIRGAVAGQSELVPIVRGVNGAASVTAVSNVPWPITSTVLDPTAHCLAYPAGATAAPAPRHPPGWTPWRGSLHRAQP